MSKTKTVYENSTSEGVLTVDCIQVPKGMLYITTHHGFRTMNTTFVSYNDEQWTKNERSYVDPEKVEAFLKGER